MHVAKNNPRRFAREWETAWNARDAEAVLAHFHDDAVFTSPVAQRIGFSADGVVRGKEELRRYWSIAMAMNPMLHFTVTGVYEGIDLVVIAFKTQDDIERAEVLRFSQGLIVEGHGTFPAQPE